MKAVFGYILGSASDHTWKTRTEKNSKTVKKRTGKICTYGLLAAVLFTAGCGQSNRGRYGVAKGIQDVRENNIETTQQEQIAQEKKGIAEYMDADLSEILPEETVTLNVYSQLSSYQGEQQGWFAQILLDLFHVKLKFVYDGSDDFYEKQAADGDLGDIVIWGTDSGQYRSAMADGLLFDWETDDCLDNYGTYMKTHMEKALEKNRKHSDGHIYGFGYDVASKSGEFGDFDYHPDIRWDLYEQIGKPAVKELEDYVGVLKQMKEICPVSDSGKETYGVSLFNDWDGDMMMFAKSTCANFFGQDEFGVGFYDVTTGQFEGCLQDGGSYLRVLRFYNALYREGLLDLQSQTQGYEGCIEDYRDGAAFFCIFGWLAAPEYNSVNHTADGKIMLPLAAQNQNTLVYGLNEYGGNRLWTIGAKTKYPQLVMAVMNWLCTPQGKLTMEYGPKGVGWDYDMDKNICLLEPGYRAKTGEEVAMPKDSGFSGIWQDGIPQFNNTTWTVNTLNSESNGQTYQYTYWPNVAEMNISEAQRRWQDETGACTAKEYLSGFSYSVSKPNTYTASPKSSDLGEIWGNVSRIIRDGSWDVIFAQTENECEKKIAQMCAEADRAGYQKCTAWCEKEARLRRASEEYQEDGYGNE